MVEMLVGGIYLGSSGQQARHIVSYGQGGAGKPALGGNVSDI
jgi:hypothetical protein